MNEKDLNPFDWEEYKAGDGVYYLAKNGIVRGDKRIYRVEGSGDDTVYGTLEGGWPCYTGSVFEEISISELRLPKKTNKKRIGNSFDDFMKEYIQE